MTGSTAGLFAAWANAHLQQHVPYDDVVAHVLGHKSSRVQQSPTLEPAKPWDDPADVEQLLSPGEVHQMSELIAVLRERGAPRLHAAFPIAGDAGGIGPGPALAPAYDAGAAVVVEGLGHVIVVTDEDAEAIEFTVFPSTARIQYISVTEASIELTETIQRSVDALDALGVRSWDDQLGRVATRAFEEAESHALPPGCPSRATHLLVRAHQLEVVLQSVDRDPGGGTITTHDAATRDNALRPLRRQVARAFTAAYNSLPY